MGRCIYCNQKTGFFSKFHKECERSNKQAKCQIDELSKNFFQNKENVNIDNLKYIADQSYVTASELNEILVNSYSEYLYKFLDDGTLSLEEENKLAEYIDTFQLTQDDLETTELLSRTFMASILRQLINGEKLTKRIDIKSDLPFKFQKSEYLIWLFLDVELFEQRVKTTYEGGSQGISLRIAKGVYYRTSKFKGYPVKTTNVVPIANGIVALTNKHVYFSSETKNFRINYEKIITIQSYSDGIGITKDGITAKPQIFKNVDGWFCYNFIKNISEYNNSR